MKIKTLKDAINSKISNSLEKVLSGEQALHLVETGASVFINQDRAKAKKPKNRSVVAQNPTASILIKKKAFSTFRASNDLKWLDRTEKMLLRATKALFSYKVNQLRAYESLTKLNDFEKQYSEVNFNIFIEALNSAKYLDIKSKNKTSIDGVLNLLSSSFSDLNYDALKEDVIRILKKNIFSQQSMLSTWIVDPDNIENYGLGPGTGVIELCNFTNLSSNVVVTAQGASGSFTVIDPYRVLNIIDDDIEMAIEEALYGTLGLLNDLAYGSISTPPLDTNLIVSSAFELAGLGELDPTIDIDYVRQQLRIFYSGKTLINVGDEVHFYIAGNKYVKNSSDPNNMGFENSVDDSYFNIDEDILEAERRLYTNRYVDSETYKKLRNYSNAFSMQHVFGGFVKSVSEKFSAQQGNSINVSCSSNMDWLTWSRFMEEPTLNDPRGVLEDPLTPYKINKDSDGSIIYTGAPELLDENKELLRTGLLSFDNGMLAGSTASESNIYQGQASYPGSIYGKKIIQHPSGLIYRWKTGILTATADIQNGSDSEALASRRVLQQIYGMLVSDSAVSNLDVANAVATMVTGQPYNVESFTRLAFEAMNFVRKDNSFNPTTAYSTILNSIKNQNRFYGNFKPFRQITLSQKTANQLSSDYFAFDESKNQLSKLRTKKNEIKNKILQLKSTRTRSSISQQLSFIIGSLQAELNVIDAKISQQLSVAKESIGVDSSQLLYQEILNNYNISDGGVSADQTLNKALSTVATQRRFEDVKLNKDQNYLIISDLYDVNTEIKLAALNLKRQNFSLFKASYTPVLDRITNLIDHTGFEFFCNSQGHLELRPPLWNRTPLTVLNALFEYQKKTSKTIVPPFLFKLFDTRISSLKLEISSLNIKIAILALLLGRYPDCTLIPSPTENGALRLPLTGENSLEFFGLKISNVASDLTITNSTGIISDNKYLFLDFDWIDSKKDSVAGNVTDLLGAFDSIFLESKALISSNLSNYDLSVDLIVNSELASSSGFSNYSSISKFSSEQLESIRQQFIRTTGIDPLQGFSLSDGKNITSSDFAFSSSEFMPVTNKVSYIFSQLENAISNRNSLVTVLNNNIDKQEELNTINSSLLSGFSEPTLQEQFDQTISDKVSGFASTLVNARKAVSSLNNLLSGKAFLPTLFEHLIEDDSKNDLGPGSGRRFIINDEDIEDFGCDESRPDFTRVDVFGQSSLIDDELKKIYSNENLMFWAGATDFDMWRQYGYIPKTINAPFSNSAEYGSKPLALLHMTMQRVKIFTGSITVSGNEFYQPGDTVYIPSKGLLFYVTRVSHSFSFGSKFSTTLQLEYGHPAGVYLPTPLDIIGEQYNKQFLQQGEFLNIRTTIGDDNYRELQPDSCIVFPPEVTIEQQNVDVLLSYKDNQVAFYNMITDLSIGLLAGTKKLLIRGFIQKKGDSTSEVQKRIDIIKYLFLNPVMITQVNPSVLGDDLIDTTSLLSNIFHPIGNSKELMPITLPNGIECPKVTSDQIIEQISFINKELDQFDNPLVTGVRCLSISSIGEHRMDGKEITIDDLISIFPKGGPKQSTLLKAKDESSTISIDSISRTIEIGILTISESQMEKIK